MASYLIDEYGNKTHVVIPIDEWEHYKSLKNINLDKTINSEMPVIVDDCPSKQLHSLLPLIESMDFSSVDEWQQEYKDFFKYMERLKYKDIYVLYLIRSSEFIYNLSNCYTEEDLDRFTIYYGITKKMGADITLADWKELSKMVFTLNDEDFLNLFNKKFKINKIVEKKIRIDAEINRLFIFDMMERFPTCMMLDYDITVKEAQKKLMKFLYNEKKGAKTQVQRALRQVNMHTTL